MNVFYSLVVQFSVQVPTPPGSRDGRGIYLQHGESLFEFRHFLRRQRVRLQPVRHIRQLVTQPLTENGRIASLTTPESSDGKL